MAHTKKTIAGNVNNGTANTFSYSGSFDVFKASEVEVELDNVKLTFTTSTINESASPREYTVDFTNKTVHIGGADLVSTNSVVIQPVTDMGDPTPRATYSPGASVTSADLNNNQLQVMRKAMEYDEQKLSSRGGTMTGNLHMGENVDISFEGATENNFETTLTVADPTADRTITFPDTTGTVVTTGDTGTVATAMIAADAVNGDKIADDAINSEHIADGSVDLVHLSSNSVNSSKIVDGSIAAADLASDAVSTVKIADDAVTADKLADTSVTAGSYTATDLTVDAQGRITAASSGTIAGSEIAADAIDGTKIADDSINSEHYVDGSIDHAHLSNDCIDGDNIQDDVINSEHYAADSIDTEHYAPTSVDSAALASNSVTESKITDANVTTDKIANSNITLGKLHGDLKQTTISDSDTQLPTSGAVVDYVAAQLAPIGGLEVIATDAAFPNTQPASGVVISIADAGGLVVNGSGTSTTGRTVGGSTVTINNINSAFNSSTVDAGVSFMVSSTGSGQIYNFHKATLKESDILNLSNDINDFGNRYRVFAGEPSSNNDEGDLVYDTNANKMKVYDNSTSAWKEVTSVGDFKYLFLCPAGGSGAPTLNGNIATYDLRESSNSGSAASVTSAAQLLVSVNGVVQKANTGTSAPSEGFALVDSNTIIFGANLQSGDSVFIVQIGSAVTINSPGDGTVSEAKITSGAVTQAKIGDQAVNEAKLQVSNSPTNGYFLSAQSGNTGGLTWAAVPNSSLMYPNGGTAVTTSTNNEIQINSSNSKVVFDTDTNNTYEISFAGPSSLTKTSAYTLPEDGSNGQFLKTNGSGVLSFATVSNEGTSILSTGESGGSKFLREDGDGTCSWQSIPAGVGGATGVDFNDNVKARFGTGNDLELYHDGSDSFITNATGHLRIKGSGTDDKHIYLQPDDGDNGIIVVNNAEVQLFHNNTQKFATTSNGAAVINTTSPQTSASSSANELVVSGDGTMGMTLHTNSTTGQCNIYFSDTDSAYPGAISYLHQHNQIRLNVNGNYSAPVMQFNSDLTIYFQNTIYSNGASYSTGSDLRMKSNLVQFTNTLDDLKKITGYKFDIKNSTTNTTRKSAGLIAQEVEQIYPDFVVENPETGMKSLEYNTFIGVLVEAVKELTTKVETLETKVAALEAA